MKTYLIKNKEIKREWWQADASKFVLGRLSTRVANILRGKHKATFAPHMDIGDFVVIKNAEKVKFTGRKLTQKKYHRHTGYPGGVRTKSLADRMEKEPANVIRDSVMHMIDNNRLRKNILRRLKIVVGDKHSYPVTKEIA
jgi:large subunit ribosomal protein L13